MKQRRSIQIRTQLVPSLGQLRSTPGFVTHYQYTAAAAATGSQPAPARQYCSDKDSRQQQRGQPRPHKTEPSTTTRSPTQSSRRCSAVSFRPNPNKAPRLRTGSAIADSSSHSQRTCQAITRPSPSNCYIFRQREAVEATQSGRLGHRSRKHRSRGDLSSRGPQRAPCSQPERTRNRHNRITGSGQKGGSVLSGPSPRLWQRRRWYNGPRSRLGVHLRPP